jgi:hypothetical protein
MPVAIVALAKEPLEQDATARVEAWFTKYDRMPGDLAKTLAASNDIPVDIDSVFSFPEPVR